MSTSSGHKKRVELPAMGERQDSSDSEDDKKEIGVPLSGRARRDLRAPAPSSMCGRSTSDSVIERDSEHDSDSEEDGIIERSPPAKAAPRRRQEVGNMRTTDKRRATVETESDEDDDDAVSPPRKTSTTPSRSRKAVKKTHHQSSDDREHRQLCVIVGGLPDGASSGAGTDMLKRCMISH